MSFARIFRIEHRSTKSRLRDDIYRGAYGDLSYSELHGTFDRLSFHPAPSEDKVIDNFLSENIDGFSRNLKEYIFGFGSLYSLRRWFIDSDLDSLRHRGYVCRVYEIQDSESFVISDRQAIFKIGSGRQIVEFELNDIHELYDDYL
jgi:hypothetical protein